MNSRPVTLDVLIAGRAGAAAAGPTHPFGSAARTAHVWTETLHTRAQIRAERHLRGARQ